MAELTKASRKALEDLRDKLYEVDTRLASLDTTAELVAKSKAVIEEGKKLAHEQMQGMTMTAPGQQRKVISREDYEKGRALLDALPPGLYLKCSGCEGWWQNGDFHFQSGGYYCEKCA